jgi:hypothetical protein
MPLPAGGHVELLTKALQVQGRVCNENMRAFQISQGTPRISVFDKKTSVTK